MNVVLWIAQSLLAAAFLAAGSFKLATPIAELATKMPFVLETPELLVRFIGASEVAGALGLILPGLTRVQPKLTPLAGALLALVMVLAAGFHLSRAEYMILPNLILGGLAAFVAWGRTKAHPLSARGTVSA